MLQIYRIKIVVRAIYTYHFFAYTDTLSSGGKYKVAVIAVFLSKLYHRPLFHEDYSSVRISFNMPNKHHTLPYSIRHVSWNLVCLTGFLWMPLDYLSCFAVVLRGILISYRNNLLRIEIKTVFQEKSTNIHFRHNVIHYIVKIQSMWYAK